MKRSIYGILSIVSIATFYSCSGKNNKTSFGNKKDNKDYIDVSMLDSTILPGDDFFDYVNKKWIEKNPIPASKSSWGIFSLMNEQTLKVLKDIQETAAKDAGAQPGSSNQILGDFYSSGMDSISIDKAGISPLKPMLDEIDQINSPELVATHYGKMTKSGGGIPFAFFVDQDLKNATSHVAYVSQYGLGLPDRDYYFRMDDKSVKDRDGYKSYIKKIFVLIGSDEPTAAKQASNVFDIELQLAKSSMTLVDQRDPYATYHKMGIDGLKNLTSNFNWDVYFAEIGVDKIDSLVIGMPSFLKVWNGMLKKTDSAKWKDYYKFHLVNDNASELSSNFAQAHFEFYDKQLSGVQEQDPRWKRVTSLSDYLLRDLIGQEYVKLAFDENSKKKAIQLVENLRNALSERIKNLSWMGDSTKLKAQEKLGKIMVKIGYPDKWWSYEGIGIKKQAFVLNVIAASEYDFNRMVSKLGKPIDRTEWGMGPQTLNAYYNPLLNEIVFPAAILQPPLFDANADEAINYGGIGMVIGHELTHGFDDQGKEFDAEGNLKNWWTKVDEENYARLTKKFVDQYNGYIPADSVHINGELTLGENIADLGGMIIAYTAYKKATANKPEDKINGLTPDMRFFINFAQVWRNHSRKDDLIQQLYTDPHSPDKYRVLGVLSNFPEFYKVFNVTEKNKMFIREELRCTMW